MLYTEPAPDGANELTGTPVGTWDSHGHPIANRGLDPPGQVIETASGLIVDNAVVLEGSLFALHCNYGAMHVPAHPSAAMTPVQFRRTISSNASEVR